jgi:hypothetical protein
MMNKILKEFSWFITKTDESKRIRTCLFWNKLQLHQQPRFAKTQGSTPTQGRAHTAKERTRKENTRFKSVAEGRYEGEAPRQGVGFASVGARGR